MVRNNYLSQEEKENFIKGLLSFLGLFFTILLTSKDINLSLYSGITSFVLWNYKLIERIFLGKISLVIFILIIFCAYSIGNTNFIVQNKDIFYIVGGLIAFWYGYKRYERDKELEILEKYVKKYNSIISVVRKYDITKKKGDYSSLYLDLFNLWYEEYFLYKKGYISHELWDEWEGWIKDDLEKILNQNRLGGYKKSLHVENFIEKFCEKNNEKGINYYNFIKKIILEIIGKNISYYENEINKNINKSSKDLYRQYINYYNTTKDSLKKNIFRMKENMYSRDKIIADILKNHQL